jgi:excinuclease ABC subunit A
MFNCPETCNGKRFKKELLEVAFAGKNIHDILTMTIDDAVFETNEQHKITQKLNHCKMLD